MLQIKPCKSVSIEKSNGGGASLLFRQRILIVNTLIIACNIFQGSLPAEYLYCVHMTYYKISFILKMRRAFNLIVQFSMVSCSNGTFIIPFYARLT